MREPSWEVQLLLWQLFACVKNVNGAPCTKEPKCGPVRPYGSGQNPCHQDTTCASLFPAQPPGVESSRQARQASGSAVYMYMYHPLVAVQPLSVVSRVGFTVNVLNWPQSSHNLNDPWCTEGSRAGHSGTHAGDGTNWLLGGSALSYLQTGGASTSKVQWRRPLRCSSDHGFSPITASHRGDPAAECGQP